MEATEAQGTPASDRNSRIPRALAELSRRFAGGRVTAGVHAYEVLREAVLSGVFGPNEPLRQEALAAALGLSRVPVRSAIFQLEQDGLLEVTERGAFVRKHSAAQLRELYQIRAVLEAHALRLSIRTMTPERVSRLRQLSVESDAQPLHVVDPRAEFLAELFDVERNPELVQLLRELRAKVTRYIHGWRMHHDHAHAHVALLDAIEAGDEAQAVRLLLDGLIEVRNDILASMDGAQHPGAAHRRTAVPRTSIDTER